MHHGDEDIALLAFRADLCEQDEHLKTCPACRARVHHVLRIHAEYVKASSLPPDPRVMRGLSPLETPHEIHLRPWHTQVEIPGAAGANQITLLAAQGGLATGESPGLPAVFASESAGTLLRVVEEEEAGVYSLFVLADDARKQECVLLGFVTKTGERLLLATDEHGVASCTSEEPIGWVDASAVLYLPIAEFTLESGWADGTFLHSRGITLEITRLQDGIRLHCRNSSPPVPRRALLRYADGCAGVVEMVAGVIGVSPARADALRSIRIFS